MSETIRVAVRVRPLSINEKEENSKPAWVANMKNSNMLRIIDQKRLSYDFVFDELIETYNVYIKTAKSIVLSALEGINGTIFAYGQTSSGKTYTMRGSPENHGIIPLAMKDLFSLITNKFIDREFLLKVSYLEIYNETIRDLLSSNGMDLKIFQNINGGVFVDCLTQKVVINIKEVMEQFDIGEESRHYGETKMNKESSRSHTIFQLNIESRLRKRDDNAVRSSTINLVDLAGSEKQRYTDSKGVRLKEGGHINKSLLTLERVIKALSENENVMHIPYRDSKLTRILQPAIGGNSKTVMICTVTPAKKFTEETKSTLAFATRAKTIINSIKVNEKIDDSTIIYRLEQKIKEYKELLSKSSENKKTEETENLKEKLLALRAELKQSRISEAQWKKKFQNIIFKKPLYHTEVKNSNHIKRRMSFSSLYIEKKKQKFIYNSNNIMSNQSNSNLLLEKENNPLIFNDKINSELKKLIKDKISKHDRNKLENNKKLSSLVILICYEMIQNMSYMNMSKKDVEDIVSGYNVEEYFNYNIKEDKKIKNENNKENIDGKYIDDIIKITKEIIINIIVKSIDIEGSDKIYMNNINEKLVRKAKTIKEKEYENASIKTLSEILKKSKEELELKNNQIINYKVENGNLKLKLKIFEKEKNYKFKMLTSPIPLEKKLKLKTQCKKQQKEISNLKKKNMTLTENSVRAKNYQEIIIKNECIEKELISNQKQISILKKQIAENDMKYKENRQEKSTIGMLVSSKDSQISKLKNDNERLIKELRKLNVVKSDSANLRITILSHVKKISNLEKTIEKNKTDHKSYLNESTTNLKIIDSMQDKIKKLKKTLIEKDNLIDSNEGKITSLLNENTSITKKYNSKLKENEEYSAKISSHSKEIKKINDKFKEKIALESTISKTEIQKLNDQLKYHKDELDKKEEKIKEIESSRSEISQFLLNRYKSLGLSNIKDSNINMIKNIIKKMNFDIIKMKEIFEKEKEESYINIEKSRIEKEKIIMNEYLIKIKSLTEELANEKERNQNNKKRIKELITENETLKKENDKAKKELNEFYKNVFTYKNKIAQYEKYEKENYEVIKSQKSEIKTLNKLNKTMKNEEQDKLNQIEILTKHKFEREDKLEKSNKMIEFITSDNKKLKNEISILKNDKEGQNELNRIINEKEIIIKDLKEKNKVKGLDNSMKPIITDLRSEVVKLNEEKRDLKEELDMLIKTNKKDKEDSQEIIKRINELNRIKFNLETDLEKEKEYSKSLVHKYQQKLNSTLKKQTDILKDKMSSFKLSRTNVEKKARLYENRVVTLKDRNQILEDKVKSIFDTSYGFPGIKVWENIKKVEISRNKIKESIQKKCSTKKLIELMRNYRPKKVLNLLDEACEKVCDINGSESDIEGVIILERALQSSIDYYEKHFYLIFKKFKKYCDRCKILEKKLKDGNESDKVKDNI